MSVVKHPQPPPPLQVTPKRFVYFVVYNERKACISSFPLLHRLFPFSKRGMKCVLETQ